MNEEKEPSIGEKISRIDKKRRMIGRAGVASPLIMSLMNKTALGAGVYHCSISGAQSGNVSSHPDVSTNCGVGFSPGGWCQNADKTGNQDGNIHQWLDAGVIPFKTRKKRLVSGEPKVKQIKKNGIWYPSSSTAPDATRVATVFDAIQAKTGQNSNQPTLFSDIFGGSSTATVWEAVCDTGNQLARHAAADYLNAALHLATGIFSPVYDVISPNDIVSLYQNSDSGGIVSAAFTTSSGYIVPSGFNAQAYFESIHH